MKNIFIILFLLSFITSAVSQVQRSVEGSSIIRKYIQLDDEFHFTRDWNISASFKSGIGESVKLFNIIYVTPDNKIKLLGLQMDVKVKKRDEVTKVVNSSFSSFFDKEFVYRSIFIDKDEVDEMIIYIERDIVPNIKKQFKNISKEYVFKSKEMFFSFLIDEKDARISIHIIDYGPLGDGNGGGDQIEFWTESKVDEIPDFLDRLKQLRKKMD